MTRETSESPTGTDRRRHRRVAVDWPLSIRMPDGALEARLRDISKAGVCFFLDRRIPEMTLLGMSIDLPDQGEDPVHIEGSGVVVRCQKLSPHLDHYEVAVFLNDITESNRERLTNFVENYGE